MPAISTPPKNLRSSALSETPAKIPSDKLPASNTSLNSLAHMSTSSLPIEPTVAQSAHSYLQELGAPKEKVKSRPDHASLFSDKRGFLSNLSSKDKANKENESDPTINKKFTWFTKLGKKTAGYMHQLMRTSADGKIGSLKWDNFVKASLPTCVLHAPDQCHFRLCERWVSGMILVPQVRLFASTRRTQGIG